VVKKKSADANASVHFRGISWKEKSAAREKISKNIGSEIHDTIPEQPIFQRGDRSKMAKTEGNWNKIALGQGNKQKRDRLSDRPESSPTNGYGA